jgi:hypothetical protein
MTQTNASQYPLLCLLSIYSNPHPVILESNDLVDDPEGTLSSICASLYSPYKDSKQDTRRRDTYMRNETQVQIYIEIYQNHRTKQVRNLATPLTLCERRHHHMKQFSEWCFQKLRFPVFFHIWNLLGIRRRIPQWVKQLLQCMHAPPVASLCPPRCLSLIFFHCLKSCQYILGRLKLSLFLNGWLAAYIYWGSALHSPNNHNRSSFSSESCG